MKYKVSVKETLERVIKVEADSLEAADTMVRKMYSDGEIVLDYDDFTGVEFTPERA